MLDLVEDDEGFAAKQHPDPSEQLKTPRTEEGVCLVDRSPFRNHGECVRVLGIREEPAAFAAGGVAHSLDHLVDETEDLGPFVRLRAEADPG